MLRFGLYFNTFYDFIVLRIHSNRNTIKKKLNILNVFCNISKKTSVNYATF